MKGPRLLAVTDEDETEATFRGPDLIGNVAVSFDPEGARRHLGLDAPGFARIFECIWTEVSERRSLLEEAFEDGDLTRVALHAHTIKSSAATIGAIAMSQAAAAVERAADEGHAEKLTAALEAFCVAKETLSKLLGMG